MSSAELSKHESSLPLQQLYKICACRAAMPMRHLEEIMLHEQKLAADADKAEGDDI